MQGLEELVFGLGCPDTAVQSLHTLLMSLWTFGASCETCIGSQLKKAHALDVFDLSQYPPPHFIANYNSAAKAQLTTKSCCCLLKFSGSLFMKVYFLRPVHLYFDGILESSYL
jgi:hypothetical protein